MKRQLPVQPLAILFLVFFLSVIARLIFSPLLLTIEEDLGIGHANAGSLFLFVSIGYAPMILLSGFVAERLKHRGTILLSMSILAGFLMFISYTNSIGALRIGMCGLGVGAGLYTASGLASLMKAVPANRWGTAIAVHEAAPNIASITAPIIAVAWLSSGGWRSLTRLFAILCIGAIIVLLVSSKWAGFRGATPKLGTLKVYLKNRSFRILTILFALSSCAAIGVYSILPTYLVAERGMNTATANALMSIGRTAGLGLVFAAGYLSDRIGVTRIIGGSIAVTAIFTILLGVLPISLLPIAIIVQPMIAVAFFPAALASLARIGPQESQNVGVSLIIPVAILAGGGLFPAIMGSMGEHGNFYVGFIVLGIILIAGLLLLPGFHPGTSSDG